MKTTLKCFALLKLFKDKELYPIMKGLVVFSLMLVAISGFACPKCGKSSVTQVNDTIYGTYQVDKAPEYPGGLAECVGFININIDREKCEGKEGRVILSMVVNSDGSLSDIELLRGVSRAVDKEIVRIVKKMPKWNPGTLNGQPVRVKITLPVMAKFGLNQDCDEPAAFPGGQKALERFLKDNIVCLKDENWLNPGLVKVLVSFVVDEFGNIRNVLVREGVNFQVDQEAVRIVEKMPKWTPAMKDNKPVSTERSIHVYIYISKTPRFDGAF